MYTTEEYVKNWHIGASDRRALAQVRCDSAPISAETGLYRNGSYMPCEECICPLCRNGVGDGCYVLMKCQMNVLSHVLPTRGNEIYLNF